MTSGSSAPAHQVYRSSFARVLAWVWFAIAAFNLVDIARRGEGRSAVVATAVVLFITAIVYATAFRPEVLAREDGLLLRNVVRDVYIPWSAVTAVDAYDTLRIRAGDRVFHSWAVQAPNRSRRKALRQVGLTGGSQGKPNKRVEEEMTGVTHADFVARQLMDMRRRHHKGASGQVRLSWALAPIVGMIATALVVVATIVL